MSNRKCLRLNGYDYSAAGYYFVTVCTSGRQCLFWNDTHAGLEPSRAGLEPSRAGLEPSRAGLEPAPTGINRLGDLVLQTWLELPTHTTGVQLDHFVVMPNHVHGIVILKHESAVGAGSKPAHTPTPLPEVMRQFKTFSARKINSLRGTPGIPIWQRSYYDHIIRDEEDYLRIRNYIDTNPARWAEDKYYIAQES